MHLDCYQEKRLNDELNHVNNEMVRIINMNIKYAIDGKMRFYERKDDNYSER
jgi:hypothetical protein